MDKKTPSKSDLLNKLTIDREKVSEPVKTPMTKFIILALISAVLGGLVTHYFYGKAEIILTQKTKASNTVKQAVVSYDNETDNKNNQSLNAESQVRSEQTTKKTILNASGYITARRVATVSAQIMGLIMEVNVEEGMTVSKDQILAQLDDTSARISLEQAQAQLLSITSQLQRAQASLEEAQRQYRRTMSNKYSSVADKSLAQTNQETAKADVNVIMANIAVAKVEVKQRQELVDQHTIRAPFSGVVTMKNAQPGEIVAPSSAGGGFTRTGICTIVDMDSLEIEVDVNESFIGRVKAGQKVLAQLDAYPDWVIPASVTAIIPTADRGKATVTVRINIDINSNKILPDMGVKVAFLKSEQTEPTE